MSMKKGEEKRKRSRDRGREEHTEEKMIRKGGSAVRKRGKE